MVLQDLGYSLVYAGLGAFTGFVFGALYGMKSGKKSGQLEGWIEANKELLDKIRVRKGDLARPFLQLKTLVLVVEDNEETRELMESSLKMYGYRVIGAASGAAALRELVEHNPQAVILDINLPDMDGISVARTMRGMDPKLKIVAVTGYDITDEIRQEVDSALQKPYDLFQLIKSIEQDM